MLHEVFQEAIGANRWDDESLTRFIELTATRYLEKLFEIGVEVPRAVDHMKSRVVEMQAWAEVYVGAKPKVDILLSHFLNSDALVGSCCRQRSKRGSNAYEHQ